METIAANPRIAIPLGIHITPQTGVDSYIGDGGAIALAAAAKKYYCNLRYLSADYGKITDEGFKAIVTAPFPHLTHLELPDNRISDIGLEALKDSPLKLTSLDLAGNHPATDSIRMAGLGWITDKGLMAIGKSGLDSLKELNISRNWLTIAGLYEFADTPVAQNLERMNIIHRHWVSPEPRALSPYAILRIALLPNMKIVHADMRLASDVAHIIAEAGGNARCVKAFSGIINASELKAQVAAGLQLPDPQEYLGKGRAGR